MGLDSNNFSSRQLKQVLENYGNDLALQETIEVATGLSWSEIVAIAAVVGAKAGVKKASKAISKFFGKPKTKFEIIEDIGTTLELTGTTKSGKKFRVITDIVEEGTTIILDGFHMDINGDGNASLSDLRDIARSFGKRRGAKKVIIRGGVRTGGARPGHVPREITIPVE